MKEELRDFRRARILYEAAELFYERGYRGTTVDAIADRMGVTKPFIYYYMRDKAEILSAICEYTIELPLKILDRAVAEGGPPGEILYCFLTGFARAQIENRTLVAVFFREEVNLPPRVREKMNRLRGEFDHHLTDLLKKGAAAEEFAIDDPALVSLAIGGVVCWIFTWYKPTGRLSPDEVCKHIAGLGMRMVGAAVPAAGDPAPTKRISEPIALEDSRRSGRRLLAG